MKSWSKDFLVHTNILTMIAIRLFYNCEKVFIVMNIWIIGNKTLGMKHEWNITWKRRFLMQIMCVQKDFVRFWNKKIRRISWFVFSKQYIVVSWCFWNLRNMCLKIYELDPAKFLSPPPELSLQVTLKKKTKRKSRYFIWYWYVINGRERY